MTVLTYSRAGMLGGMEAVLLGSPEDVCLHQAYATALLAQGDDASVVRARFIQTQFKLEGRLSDEERKKLVGRERKLLRDHGKAWLGELAGWLLQPTYAYTMRRGWLDSVAAPELDEAFVRALAKAPIAPLLRSLTFAHDRPAGPSALAVLLDSPLVSTLTTFRLGQAGAGKAPAEALREILGGPLSKEATEMRTFEFNDGRSHKFWNITLSGASFTIETGKVGGRGNPQTTTFPNEGAARREHDRLIAEQREKGFAETTAPPPKALPPERAGLEAALAEDPDDLASHRAYADYLSEQGDPLGEFVRVQLALEDAGKTPAQRQKLQQQEKELLDAHARTWLGELAPFLLDAEAAGTDLFQAGFSFRRGWLDALKADFAAFPLLRALARAPEARLLRRVEIPHTHYADNRNPLEPLANAPSLANVREFILGVLIPPEEEDQFLTYGPDCETNGDGCVGIVKGMPRLEELRLLCRPVDTAQLFALQTLRRLRILHVDYGHDYPLEVLADNPALGDLTHLLIWPHALEYGADPYVRTPGVKALVNSPHLKSLTHLRLRCSDMGDEGVREIIASGALKRLVWLDLRHGNVTDEGAQALADALAVSSLRHLDLYNNGLTAQGVQALQATGVAVRADGQHDPDDPNRPYLYCGDFE